MQSVAALPARPSSVKITIKEIQRMERGKWLVELTSTHRTSRVELIDPFVDRTLLGEDGLRWILEEHANQSPYDRNRADGVRTQLEGYRHSLLSQLELSSFFGEDLIPGSDLLLEIIDSGPESTFHGLHWEILEGHWVDAVGHPPVVLRRRIKDDINCAAEPKIPDRLHRTFNILMVVSRPDREDDIDPTLGSAIIVDVINSLPDDARQHVTFEIVRPGTWDAFENCISERTETWWNGGGSGAWFDVVHFDTHGVIHDGEAYLLFSTDDDEDEEETFAQSTDEIVRTLRQNLVPLVFLNACNSATTTEDAGSNLAASLVRGGIQTAIGMSFKFTSAATKAFVMFFYQSLLACRGRGVDLSTVIAREALDLNRSRSAAFKATVQLPDYIIPVMFTRMELSTEGYITDFKTVPVDASGLSYVSIANRLNGTQVLSSARRRVEGRQHDVIALESCLLRSLDSNVLLLYGMAGVGKTEFMTYLSDWWKQTGFVEDSHRFDLKESGQFGSCCMHLRETLVAVRSRDQTDSRKRHLIVIDNIDAISHPFYEASLIQRDERRRELRLVVSQLMFMPVFVVLVSRCREDWIHLRDSSHYELVGLPHMRTMDYAADVLWAIGLEKDLEDTESNSYLGYLMSRLGGNPVAIRALLTSLALERRSIEELCATIETQFVYLHRDDPAVIDCLGFVSRLLQGVLPDRLQKFQHIGKYTLWAIAWFNNILSEDFYTGLVAALAELAIEVDAKLVREYVEELLLCSGWMKLVQDTSASQGISTKSRDIKIHPLFTQCIRLYSAENFASNVDQQIRLKLLGTVVRYYDLKLIEYLNMPQDPLSVQMVLVQVPNLTSTFQYLCRAVQIHGYYNMFANSTLRLVFTVFAASNPVLYPMFVPFKMAETLKEALIHSPHAENFLMDEIHVDVIRAEHLQDRDPDKAAEYTEYALRTFFKLMLQCSGVLEPVEASFVFSTIAKGLVVWGNVAAYGDNKVIAAVAYRFALLFESFLPNEMALAGEKFAIKYGTLQGLESIASHPNEAEMILAARLRVLKADTILLTQIHDEVAISRGLDPPSSYDFGRPIWLEPNPSAVHIRSLDYLMTTFGLNRSGPKILSGSRGLHIVASWDDFEKRERAATSGLRGAMQRGDNLEEYVYRSFLVDCAVHFKNWEVAAQHTLVQEQLERDTQYGPSERTRLISRKARKTRAAFILLRVGHWEHGVKILESLLYRNRAPEQSILLQSNTANEYIRETSFVVENGLMTLIDHPYKDMRIDRAEFLGLRRITTELMRAEVMKRWPEHKAEDEPPAPLLYYEGWNYRELQGIKNIVTRRYGHWKDLDKLQRGSSVSGAYLKERLEGPDSQSEPEG